MTRELLKLANGRVILALEGGYDLAAICDSAETCVRVLVGEDVPLLDEATLPSPSDQACDCIWTALRMLPIRYTFYVLF